MYKPLDHNLKNHEPDDNQTIWKYMSFDYFIYLIERMTLYLPRTDNNPIYFEGQLTDEDTKKLAEYYKRDRSDDPLRDAIIAIKSFEKFKGYTFIDSWHNNENECFAMWKIFGKSNNSIALKSKVFKLKEVYENTEPDCSIAKVHYYKKEDTIDFYNSHLMFIRKPIFFNYEKEIRGIIQYNYSFEIDKRPFRSISIKSFAEFIDEIIISPYSSEWFLEILKKILIQNKLSGLCVKNSTYRIQKHIETNNG